MDGSKFAQTFESSQSIDIDNSTGVCGTVGISPGNSGFYVITQFGGVFQWAGGGGIDRQNLYYFDAHGLDNPNYDPPLTALPQESIWTSGYVYVGTGEVHLGTLIITNTQVLTPRSDLPGNTGICIDFAMAIQVQAAAWQSRWLTGMLKRI